MRGDTCLRRPTLDDVFLSLTGRASVENSQIAETPVAQTLERRS